MSPLDCLALIVLVGAIYVTAMIRKILRDNAPRKRGPGEP